MTLHAKIAMSDFQRYPWNLHAIKNVEEIVVFLDRNLFNIDNFSIAFYKQEMRKLLSQRIRKKTLNSFKKQKFGDVTHIWLANVFKGTVVNRAFQSAWRVTWKYSYSPCKDFHKSSKRGEEGLLNLSLN